MSKVLTRTATGFTHYFGLDVINVVPEYFTGTFNGVAKATGISAAIDGTVVAPPGVGQYGVCVRGGVWPNGQVFQLGHIYKEVSSMWVDQGIKDGTRMVPVATLAGDIVFVAGLEYTYVEDLGRKNRGYNHVTYPTVTPNVSMGLAGQANPYTGGNGIWRISGETIATTPVAYQEAPSSTMRYGVGQYTVQATKGASNIQVFYTVDSIEQFRQDPRTVSWKDQATLTDSQMTSINSPVTAFKIKFGDTTPGLAAIVVN